MTSNAARIRCRNDLDMYETLLEHREVKKANEAIARHEDATPTGIRRRLMATSVRLSPRMAPDVHRMANDCAERYSLWLDRPKPLANPRDWQYVKYKQQHTESLQPSRK